MPIFLLVVALPRCALAFLLIRRRSTQSRQGASAAAKAEADRKTQRERGVCQPRVRFTSLLTDYGKRSIFAANRPYSPHMKRVELIIVKDTFWLIQSGVQMLTLHPDFAVPTGGWKKVTEKVMIVRPDGCNIEATAEITMQHFNIRDPNVSIDKRWRVGLYLTDAKKDDVPIGSKILVSQEIKDALHPKDAA